MTYQRILIPLGHEARSAEQLNGALAFARAVDAHVVAVAASNLECSVAPRVLLSKARQPKLACALLLERAANAARRFEIACHLENIASFESIVVEAASIDAILQHMRGCDLVVLQQADPRAENVAARRLALNKAIRAATRPVLVMPHAPGVPSIGSRILVAWDGNHDATRAVADALPLLRRADRVEVITWSPPSARGLERAQDEADAVCATLAGHQVKAYPVVQVADAPLADALLAHAALREADMIVMGMGGCAPVSDGVLGSTSQRVLAQATVPVFMSH